MYWSAQGVAFPTPSKSFDIQHIQGLPANLSRNEARLHDKFSDVLNRVMRFQVSALLRQQGNRTVSANVYSNFEKPIASINRPQRPVCQPLGRRVIEAKFIHVMRSVQDQHRTKLTFNHCRQNGETRMYGDRFRTNTCRLELDTLNFMYERSKTGWPESSLDDEHARRSAFLCDKTFGDNDPR